MSDSLPRGRYTTSGSVSVLSPAIKHRAFYSLGKLLNFPDSAVELQEEVCVYVVTISRDTFNDWSIGATLRKIICLLALLAGFAAMMPEHLVSQIGYHAAETPDQVRLTDLERRTSSLEALPERQAMVEAALKDLKEEVDSLNTRAWLILCAALAALLDRFLGVFGIRVRGGAA